MDLSTSRLLLTGATGFVGRNFALHATQLGASIWAPVRNADKFRSCLLEDGVPQDVVHPLSADPDSWGGVRPSHAVLAAGVLFARNSAEYFSVNVEWTLSILRALPAECQVVILSSQSAGGPTPEGHLARTENHPDHPITWYGESKLAMEQAVAREFPNRQITILRPPMIFGARDSATLPLFKMVRRSIWIKPGMQKKLFSFLAVQDVVEAICSAFSCPRRGPFYISSNQPISDRELLHAAGHAIGKTGRILRVPLGLVRLLAAAVDAVPSWRAKNPSLTRDRAREIWPNSWVVDSSAFQEATGWVSKIGLDEALLETSRHYIAAGKL